MDPILLWRARGRINCSSSSDSEKTPVSRTKAKRDGKTPESKRKAVHKMDTPTNGRPRRKRLSKYDYESPIECPTQQASTKKSLHPKNNSTSSPKEHTPQEPSQSREQHQPQAAGMDINGNKVQDDTIKPKSSKRKRRSNEGSARKRRSTKKESSRKSTQAAVNLSASPFKYTSKIQLSKKESYAVKFNRFLEQNILAVAYEKQVDVYECPDAPDTPFKLLKSFVDEKEYFYALDWSYNPDDQTPILAAGGELGVIRVLNAIIGNEIATFQHTGIINDLKFHSVHPSILASASDDRSIRLWNVHSSVCVSIFSGTLHSNQVLSIDFSEDGKYLISAGMDIKLCIWKIDEDAISSSMNHITNTQRPFPTDRIYEPEFCAKDVNTNYIDAVIWHASNVFISRSADGEVIQWQVGESKQLDLKSYNCVDHWRYLREPDQCSVFFVRMDLDLMKRFLACGTDQSAIDVWDFKDGSRSQIKCPWMKGVVRMVSFSNDSEIMCACTGAGQLIRFDKKKETVEEEVDDSETDTGEEQNEDV